MSITARTYPAVLALLLVPGVLAQVDPAPPYEERVVEVDGVGLRYLDFGGDGVPLVFVHSESWDAYTFAGFAPRFVDQARVLAVTRPGYGTSEAHPGGFGVAAQAEALVAFLDALGIDRAVFAGNSSPTTFLTQLAEHHPDRVAGLVYLAGLMPFWLQDVREADPAGAGAMNARAVASFSGVDRERSRALAAYHPDFLDDDRPPIDVPALAFAARSGVIGYEPWNEALALVGSPLMADLLRDLPPSPFADFMRRPSEDPAFRTEMLEGIQDPEARALLLRLADDPALQAEVWRYQREVVAPALDAGQERFREAFGEDLQVVRLDVPVLHGYEYRDAPELIEPHLRRFLERVVGTEAAQEVPTYSIDQFMETVRISTASLSADGEKVLFTSDASGVPNAWAVPFAGGEPVQLTHSSDAVFTHGYVPSDERFLYSGDEGGNERVHIYVRDPDGSVEDLTPGENVRALFLGWSADDHSFFFASNERDPRRMDIYEMSLDGNERTLLYRNDRGARVGAISPDRRLLAFVRRNSNRDSDLFLHDRDTGEETLLSPGEGEARPIPHGFSPDGRHLYYTTDRGSEYRYLARYEVETGEHETVLQPGWDVMDVSLSPTGRSLVVAVNNDARTEARILETATLEPAPPPSLPHGDITAVAFSRDERRLAFLVGSGRSPSDLYVFDRGGGEPRQLVRTLGPEIDPEHLVEPEVVRFASYDDLEIPGLLYRPHAASSDAPVPAVIWLRGSTDGQARVGYDPLIQYLVNHGYAVYAINHRGSSGYGKSFRAANERRHGEADLGDVVASKEMLIETGWIDPGRVGVMGPSYGGFMTMAALAFHPEEFAVGVNLYGVTNWIRTLQEWATERPWSAEALESFYAAMGDPVADRERLRRISPLFHADRITKPFLVLHGARDPRVPQTESDEIVAAARANGVPVEYIVFPDEGHGFRKKENQRRAYEAVLEFLDQHLGRDER